MSADVVFTMACKNGHKLDTDEATAKHIIYSGCAICGKPLFVKGVKTAPAKRGAR
jgi:hypothetical protein